MKNADDILSYIEDFYGLVLEKPSLYFGSPSEMEAVLFEFERLYEFIVDHNEPFPFSCDFGYRDFLHDRGYGAGRFTNAERHDSSQFHEMAAFWREYLASDWRKNSLGERRVDKDRKKGNCFDPTGKSPEEMAREINAWVEEEAARKQREGKKG